MEHTQEQPPKGTGSNATDGSGTAKPDVPQPLVNVPQAAAPRATSPADPAAQSTTPTPNTNSTSTATTTGPTPAARHPAHPPPPSVPHPALPEAEQEEMRLLSRALDAGCSLLQGRGPVNKIHQHVDAFHMCVRAQCILYDSADPGARLIGIEYIISRRLFESLPLEERKFWHSHVYEVKSGMLIAPGVPGPAEDADMAKVINTYGKTWHTWQVDRGDPLPLGPPQLMMAYTADGQVPPAALAARDQEVGCDSAHVRRRRAHLAPNPPQPHPDADHPWRTGRAWQCVMEQVDFKAPVVGPQQQALQLQKEQEPSGQQEQKQ
ncbi:hypothetical protein CHLRE_03g151850v5 [Chlamydomonas reinhardtii]|uniref:DUF1264-domain-containing protein n=1 Tax=Chlamydomonas reinhardtii TaxID=3055 RepID=A0A2K3DVR4_CHLRE|nr:uncharacterized protein CHLRE_03g151850v5 [Chlamydomonas reinhardtii]PNW84625.1 hypothetical protein CHLRE_03g151850v5 [Chlamydomonas reinhardtii]